MINENTVIKNEWREDMKDKLLIFIIGVLVGAVIASGTFFVYMKSSTCNNNNQQMQMPGGTPPSMPNEQNGQPTENSYNANNQSESSN